MTNTKQNTMEGWKKHFEANMLDGDPVNDCGGSIIAATSVWEYVEEVLQAQEERHKEEMEGEAKWWFEQQKKLANAIASSKNIKDAERVAEKYAEQNLKRLQAHNKREI